MSQNESTTFLVTDAKNLTLIDATRENSPWWIGSYNSEVMVMFSKFYSFTRYYSNFKDKDFGLPPFTENHFDEKRRTNKQIKHFLLRVSKKILHLFFFSAIHQLYTNLSPENWCSYVYSKYRIIFGRGQSAEVFICFWSWKMS